MHIKKKIVIASKTHDLRCRNESETGLGYITSAAGIEVQKTEVVWNVQANGIEKEMTSGSWLTARSVNTKDGGIYSMTMRTEL
ncbi:hypothetical protein EVAR_82865_1 [Eumeta japonica]|uniref:Uncharacterized protein n=1 Tax=Eumeta variegata TaxID=151549 RepID=A0A4C1V3U5_EUMVA|nr:hypothetical protein EVAR_82865_1 [Eumeta japonica]